MNIKKNSRAEASDKIKTAGGKSIAKIIDGRNKDLDILNVVLLIKMRCSGYRYSPRSKPNQIKNALSSMNSNGWPLGDRLSFLGMLSAISDKTTGIMIMQAI